MAVAWSSITEQFTELIAATRDALGMDPGLAFVTVGAVLLMLVPTLRSRRKATNGRYVEPKDESAAGANALRLRKANAPSPLDERFAALRVQSEDTGSAARKRHHYRAEKAESEYQLRRR